MNVIAINGSPRKDGNTSVLIKTVFEELEAQGIETKEINVGSKLIRGCIACMKCWENQDGHCAQTKDPLNDWLDEMREADGIILGSPVYHAGLSGQLKVFIDRTAMVAIANQDMFQRKAGAAVAAVRRAGAVATTSFLNTYFTSAQMILVGSSYWNVGFGMDKKEVLKDGEGLQTMQNLGKNMAWLLNSIKASKDQIPEPQIRMDVITNFIR